MNTSETIRPETASQTTEEHMNGSIGRLLRFEATANGVLCHCENAGVLLRFRRHHVIRVKVFLTETPNLDTTVAVVPDRFPAPAFTVDEQPDAIHILVEELRIVLNKSPFSIKVYDKHNHLFYEEQAIQFCERESVICQHAAGKDSHFYGLGEKTGFLDKRGEHYTMWNSDVYDPHVPEIEALYVSIPFLLHVRAGVVHGIFLDNPGRTSFDMRSSQDSYTFKTELGDVDYYILHGDSLKEVVARFTELTGRIQMPPKWAIGYHQSRYSYMDQTEVLEIAHTLRNKQIPCDAVYLDIHYMDGYRVFTFDKRRFPAPEAMVQELAELGFQVVPIVDPGVKQDARYPVYVEGVRNDYFCKKVEGDLFIGEVWPGASAFPDFTDPTVARWWGEKHQFYVDKGIHGIWNDMNEPSVFNARKTMDPDVMHNHDGVPKTHEEIHNLYGLLMSKATYEGLTERLAGERPFVLTRAGYAGIQRYAAVWTGDNRSFWEHMAMAIPMVLNLGLSGVPFAGPDVGGFAHHTSGELLARWTQMGAFFPFFRNHSAIDTIRQEPWQFGEEIEQICRKYIGLRYRLLPYLYSLFHAAAQTGLPILRPLLLEYPGDAATVGLCDQFLVGRDLLVAPVCRPDTICRSVYLPEGLWMDYWSGEWIQGGRHILASAPLATLPLFVRAGAVIPQGPEYQSTMYWSPDAPLIFNVYGGSAEKNQFVWYEDDGHSLAYQTGAYHEVEISVCETEEGIEVMRNVLHRGLTTEPETVTFRVHATDGTVTDVHVDSLFDKARVFVSR